MYTVTLGDDGAFGAEYVRPAAASIALGTSGTSVDVRRNEDGSYSYMDGGQWLVVMADTRVTAANGNVYGWRLVNGMPAPDYIDHVVTVMLGALGGTLQLTQAEDMSWWLGDMQVMSGHVHTANGNEYVLTLDAAGMWSAVYQQNMVTVALGTQGSVSLAQAEDMSWWLGTEAVESGRVEVAANGNEYVLTYADGAWAAQFRPMSLDIAGTGLTAMTREADGMYDVGADTLPANGVGDVTNGDAMYHVWMADDGGLAGVRFDGAIAEGTLRTAGNGTGGRRGDLPSDPGLSADDTKTVANEQRTHLTYEKAEFSLGSLLGGASASDAGPKVIDNVAKEIRKARDTIEVALDPDVAIGGPTVESILEAQWKKVQGELAKLFPEQEFGGKKSDKHPAEQDRKPRREDILNDIAGILDALASEDAFIAATKEDGDGVFESTALSAGNARKAFNVRTWEAGATMGTTGSTRYGTVVYLPAGNAAEATKGPGKVNTTGAEYGAYAYSTMPATQRTSHVFAPTGVAVYEGGTEAIGRSGDKHTTYSGTMALQVRFNSMRVSGSVQDLVDDKGSPWRHNFADVSRIILHDASLSRNASFNGNGNTTQVYYTAGSGRLRPTTTGGPLSTLEGRLLGTGADAGSEASGVWTVGSGTSFLAGGFGVEHVANVSRPGPADDSAGASSAYVGLTGRDWKIPDRETGAGAGQGRFRVNSGNLQVRIRLWEWGGDPIAYQAKSTGKPKEEKISLATLEGKSPGETTTMPGPTHVSEVIKELTKQRDLLSALQAIDDEEITQDGEKAAWTAVQNAVRYQLFGGQLPEDLAMRYADSDSTNDQDSPGELDTRAEALELIDRVVEALSDASSLKAALDKDTGIFAFTPSTADESEAPTPNSHEDITANGKIRGRSYAEFLAERQYQVHATLGTTDLMRFGVWRRVRTASAARHSSEQGQRGELMGPEVPGAFAYSLLPETGISDNRIPWSGSARYTGETVAVMAEAFLTGTATVDVTWGASPTMALTISDLEDGGGDPLRHSASGTTGVEIADIVFSGIGRTAVELADQKRLYFAETVTATRYRPSGSTEVSGQGGVVNATFVGQTVDGPLGVIGTWTLTDGDVGRINDDGNNLEDKTATIYGAFGAELP